MSETLSRRVLAEGLGTAFLLAAVAGSGIMGAKLAGGNIAIALLGNTLPTAAILVVLILIFGPISGANRNPAVSLAFALQRSLSWRDCAFYAAAQIVGALAGVLAAHLIARSDLDLIDLRVRQHYQRYVPLPRRTERVEGFTLESTCQTPQAGAASLSGGRPVWRGNAGSRFRR